MPPNLLLITTDQQRADTLGCYGSHLGATPHLDRLAARGVRFDEARCQHPYCQPSRWTILTGQHPRTHGVWSNAVEPGPRQLRDAFSTRAAAAGFRTSFVGKAHFATNGVFRPFASRFVESFVNSVRLSADWYGPYMGFAHAELVQLGHYPFGYGPVPLGLHYGRWLAGAGSTPSWRRAWQRFRQASPARGLTPAPSAPQTWHSALPEELHPTTWIADRAIAQLRALRDRPFFLWASFADPHHPMDPPAPWCHRFDPASMPLPRRDPAELASKPPRQAEFSRGVGRLLGDNPLAQWVNPAGGRLTDRQLGEMIAAYYGMVAMLDQHIGRILAALDDLGLAEETVVAFTSDHGELLGDHGLLFKGPFHYDGLLRVPLILSGPGVGVGVQVSDPVGTIDLVPTFERLLGVASGGADVWGQDLLTVARGEGGRELVVSENDHRIWFAEHVQTVVTREHKLNRHVGRPYGELYVRAEDPGERDNRYDDPGLRGVREDLAAALDRALPRWSEPRRRRISPWPG